MRYTLYLAHRGWTIMMISLEPPISWLLKNVHLFIQLDCILCTFILCMNQKQEMLKVVSLLFVSDSWIKGIMGDDWRFIRISSQIVLPVPGATCFWWICWPWLYSERIIECCSFSQVRKSCLSSQGGSLQMVMVVALVYKLSNGITKGRLWEPT